MGQKYQVSAGSMFAFALVIVGVTVAFQSALGPSDASLCPEVFEGDSSDRSPGHGYASVPPSFASAQASESSDRLFSPDGGVEVVAGREEERRQRRRAQRLVGALVTKASRVADHPAFRGATVETQINQTNYYQDGWIDAVLSDDTIDMDALGQEIEHGLCDSPSPVEAGLMLRIVGRIPNVATIEGIDCIVSAQQEEGPLLWEALDAYSATSLTPSDAILHWASSAQDPRTQRRFDIYRGRPPETFEERD